MSTERDVLPQDRLNALPKEVLANLRRGIEKESLRVRPDGALAITPHPAKLGSALTHPLVTTDFSEAQLELITGVHPSPEACLERAHRDPSGSVPGHRRRVAVGREHALPIAGGRCHTHRLLRHLERGPHQERVPHGAVLSLWAAHADDFRHSLQLFVAAPTFATTRTSALIRNFRRQSWLLLYLFGASPAVCSTFVAGREHQLERWSGDTLYLPYATSLRMGKLGYQSDAQSTLLVSYNNLESYAASLHEAMTRPYPAYAAIGIRDGDNYRQLAESLLQIENEFYGTIRPKRRIRPGERPLHALRERGVEYVEVRLMDLDPFCAVGIDAQTMRILDVFLLHCLLQDSPPDTPQELANILRNKQLVASRGREPGLRLARGLQEMPLFEWGAEVLAACEPIAAALDAAHAMPGATNAHREALAWPYRACASPQTTPSAQVLQAMEREHDKSYVRFVLAQSQRHRDAIWRLPYSTEAAERFSRLAKGSLLKQRQIEAADTLPFETYGQQYLAPERLNV